MNDELTRKDIDKMKEELTYRRDKLMPELIEEVKRTRVAKITGESAGGDGTVRKQPVKVVKIGRNDPCPCGSGLKWKKCTCKEYHPDQQ